MLWYAVGGLPGLVLFKVKTESLYNRPLVLHIESPSGGQGAEIDIDV